MLAVSGVDSGVQSVLNAFRQRFRPFLPRRYPAAAAESPPPPLAAAAPSRRHPAAPRRAPPEPPAPPDDLAGASRPPRGVFEKPLWFF